MSLFQGKKKKLKKTHTHCHLLQSKGESWARPSCIGCSSSTAAPLISGLWSPETHPAWGRRKQKALIFLHVVILTHMEINASSDLGNSLGDNSHFRSSLRLLRKVHSLPTPCPLPISKSQLRNQPCFSYLAKGWTFCVQLLKPLPNNRIWQESHYRINQGEPLVLPEPTSVRDASTAPP